MIAIHTQSIINMATAYIEDGLLKKWRYDHPDEDHINSILNDKFYSGKALTKEDISYILTFDNIVVVTHGAVTFHNFKLNNIAGVYL